MPFRKIMKSFFSLLVIVILLIIGSQPLTAQGKVAEGKLFYFEAGGPGVVMSVNYDSRFKPNTRYGFGYRLGVGIIPPFDSLHGSTNSGNSNNSSNVINVFDVFGEMVDAFGDMFSSLYKTFTKGNYTFPAEINYVFGRPNNASVFEIGGGITYLSRKRSLFDWDVKKSGNLVGHFSFMYRFTPLNKGLSFRIGFTPMIGTAGDLFPMGGISVGYAY